MKILTRYSLAIITAAVLVSCVDHRKNPDVNAGDTTGTKEQNQPKTSAPLFDADSAYSYIEKQAAFGPRVPNTVQHEKCADYLISTLKKYADKVEVQQGVVTAYDGKKLNIKNIIGYLNPDAKRRILLISHWDSRHVADQDSVDTHSPIIAANDGASGVGVLMEIARQIREKKPEIGVILLFVDAEDYGVPEFLLDKYKDKEADSYCLGTQYWANSIPRNTYTADYGIVLDMVGAKDARFLQEYNSIQKAPLIVDKVWKQAQVSGAGNHFIVNQTNPITDDHLYVNNIAMIPCIDIVDFDASRPKGFGWYWHTHADTMQIIDKGTLKGVGQTLLDLIFNEPSERF